MALITPADVTSRLPFDPDPITERMIPVNIEDAIILAQSYAGVKWDDTNFPELAKVLILRALVRYLRNAENIEQSRAGDETLGFFEDPLDGTLGFLPDEQEQLAELGKVYDESDLISLPTYAYTTRPAQLRDPWLDDPFGWVS